MFTIKDFCTWYNKSHNTMVKILIESQVIEKSSSGKGNRKSIAYNEKVERFFYEHGKPVEVAKRFIGQQLHLPFQK
jgi:hypothetical protein